MPDVIPLSVGTDGNFWVKFVLAIADTTAPKLATETNAASSKDLTLYLTGDGWTPASDQASAPDTRLSALQDFENPGKSSESLSVTYVTNPDVALQDVARLTLLEGTTGFILSRRAKSREIALAVGDKVDIRPFRAGVQMDVPPESNSQFKISQKLFITGPVRRLVAMTT